MKRKERERDSKLGFTHGWCGHGERGEGIPTVQKIVRAIIINREALTYWGRTGKLLLNWKINPPTPFGPKFLFGFALCQMVNFIFYRVISSLLENGNCWKTLLKKVAQFRFKVALKKYPKVKVVIKLSPTTF